MRNCRSRECPTTVHCGADAIMSCRPISRPHIEATTMGEVVDLHGQPARLEIIKSSLPTGTLRRGHLERRGRKEKYISTRYLGNLGNDEELIEAIEAEKIRRIRNGSTKREKAQQLVVKAPAVPGNIMLDASASPRHRIDASKVLDDFAANGPKAAPAADRFQITINLGPTSFILTRAIAIDANDVDPSTTPTPRRRDCFR